MDILNSIEACTCFEDLSLSEKKYFVLDTIDIKYDIENKKHSVSDNDLKEKLLNSSNDFNAKMLSQLFYVMGIMQNKSISLAATTCIEYKSKPFFEIDGEGRVERIIYHIKDLKCSILYSSLMFFNKEFLQKEKTLKLNK